MQEENGVNQVTFQQSHSKTWTLRLLTILLIDCQTDCQTAWITFNKAMSYRLLHCFLCFLILLCVTLIAVNNGQSESLSDKQKQLNSLKDSHSEIVRVNVSKL